MKYQPPRDLLAGVRVAIRMRSSLPALILSGLATLANAATVENSIGVSFPDEVAGLSFTESSIPSGTDAPIVRKHFSQVIDEVKQMERLGKARKVTLSATGEQVTSYKGCGPQFIWRAYEIDLAEGSVASYTYLTAMKNQFVKLRVSYLKGDVQGGRDAERFVQQIRKVLGSCH